MTMNKRRTSRIKAFSLVCAVIALAVQAPALVRAGIVNSSNVTVLGGPPAPNVLEGSFELPGNPSPVVFPEFVFPGVVPAGGVLVDHDGSVIASNPVRTGNDVSPALVDTVIPAGTLIESYYFHFDPNDSTFDASNFYASTSIEFSAKIIGVQVFTAGDTSLRKPTPIPYVGTLEDGDLVVALNGGPAPGYYPSGVIAHGLEEDSMGIDLAGFRINLNGSAFGSEVDQVRIFVQGVPEPGSMALAATGLLALSFLTIKRAGTFRRS
jgi:hypothetical protein